MSRNQNEKKKYFFLQKNQKQIITLLLWLEMTLFSKKASHKIKKNITQPKHIF